MSVLLYRNGVVVHEQKQHDNVEIQRLDIADGHTYKGLQLFIPFAQTWKPLSGEFETVLLHLYFRVRT